jgi:hypothetical protein
VRYSVLFRKRDGLGWKNQFRGEGLPPEIYHMHTPKELEDVVVDPHALFYIEYIDICVTNEN